MESEDDCSEDIKSRSIEDGVVCRRDSYHEEGESHGRLARFCPYRDGECDSSVHLDGAPCEPNQQGINGLELAGL